jgi:aminopeptidase YwaD
VALELARVLAARRQPFTVQVALFAAEEIGLLGSRRYVDSLTAEQRQALLADINVDMVGVGSELAMSGSDELLERALAVGEDLGLPPSRRADRHASSSDHASFQMVGLPALFITWGPDPNYHTAKDTAGEVRPQALEDTGRLVLSLLESLSSG